MARIPEEAIERIKRQTDLAALVRSRGIELKKHGNGHLAGPCPFHDDEEPSFIVTPAKGLFHCMGCGVAGNAIQFVEKFDGVSFRHAFEILNAGPVAFSPPSDTPLKQTTVRRLPAPVTVEGEDSDLFDQVVDYYHERLSVTPAALQYLEGRGLNDPEALRHFRIGFADRTLGLRLPGKKRKAGNEIRSRLQKLGLIRTSGHEHFNGSIVVPVFDERGCVAEMYGRKISRRLRKGTPLHLYLPGPHAGIWNHEALNESELILCEAPLDALTFWVNGIRNVTFIYGTEGFPDGLFGALLSHRVKTVRLAYDNDSAGNRAAVRDAERLTAHGIETFRIKFPWGMDANEYAQKVTPAGKSLTMAVQSAEWMGGKVNAPGISHARGPARSSVAAISLAALSADESGYEGGKSEALAKQAAAEGKTRSAQSEPARDDVPVLRRVGDPSGGGTGYHTLQLGGRAYRIGGLDKNNSLDVLKVSVRLRYGEDFHLDSIDMTRDADRRRFIDRAAEETRLEKELIKRDLGKLLLALEDAQHERLTAALKPETENRKPEMASDDYAEALEFLKSPDLVGRIQETFEACGLVGESGNRLAAYLACTSRKLDRPLAVIIQSTSAAGKSTLMDAVLSMFPPEDQVKYSAMTGQSLYYLGETNLKHKVLAIVEEEGAEKASYALKLLQSEGELTIASTGKDLHTGRMETQEYHVEGPVMIFLTTTAIDIDEELQNRCLTLTVDESREQTERIHILQRKARTLEGLRLKKKKQRLLTLMQNAQRLLRPIDVVNPYADSLTFTAERTRTRRDHEKYLTLIDAIALLHQHQRPRETLGAEGDGQPCIPEGGSEFITVTLEDIELANRLAPELLGRSLDDLPPQTRRVFETVKAIVRERCEAEQIEQRVIFFSRGEVRQRLGWSITQIRFHLERLRELEYVAARYGRPGRAFQYELLADCNETREVQHVGLLDVEKLRVATKPRARRGENVRVRQPPVGKNGHLSGGCRTPARQVQPSEESELTPNLLACRKRESGTLAEVAS